MYINGIFDRIKKTLNDQLCDLQFEIEIRNFVNSYNGTCLNILTYLVGIIYFRTLFEKLYGNGNFVLFAERL